MPKRKKRSPGIHRKQQHVHRIIKHIKTHGGNRYTIAMSDYESSERFERKKKKYRSYKKGFERRFKKRKPEQK